MQETKKCLTCGKVKLVTEFYKGKNGKPVNMCKACKSKKTLENRAKKGNVKMEKTAEYNINQFNSDEIAVLKKLILNYDLIMDKLNSNILVEYTKIKRSERIPKTVNLDKDIVNNLIDKAKELNLSLSDIVNITLKQYLTE